MATIFSMTMAIAMPKSPLSNKQCIVSNINGGTAATALQNRRSCRIGFKLNALQTCDEQITTTHSTGERRSGNFKPAILDYDFVQSLRSEYKEERYLKRASELISQVKTMLDDEITEVVQRLEFIDQLKRLGISYHFDDKINQILNHIHVDGCKNYDSTDLYPTALRFRLLRDHGFIVSQDVFDCFKNEDGGFKESLKDDTKGLLELYEASFMLTRGEKTLEIAQEFATKFLQKKVDDAHENIEEHLSLLVHSALDVPLNWKSPRLNSKWFINVYEKSKNMNPIVLELAKLDFNIVQATHLQELKHVSRWWNKTFVVEKLSFARDILVQNFLGAVGYLFEPQYGYERITLTKVHVLLAVIDDVFDVYGTFEELQLFNDVIQRWDIEAIDKLPDYMQICFLALNNFIDELAYHVLKKQGSFIIPHLRKSWADLCQSYLQEAEWFYKGYTPTLEEYMSNAWVSIAAPVIITHSFFLVTNPIEKETVQSLYKYHNIVRCSAIILRLVNDLRTSPEEMERGDVPKSIQCYMNESGASLEEAREHVMFMIKEAWKELNEERFVSGFQPELVRVAVDLERVSQYCYQYGDQFGAHSISNLLLEPILF